MLVKDIMTPKEKLLIMSPMATVRDALKAMKEMRVRSAVVDKLEESDAYGLLSYKNILETIVAEEGDIDLLNVYDVAKIPAVSVSALMNVKYAARMMVNSKIKRLLVIDNNEISGILTMTDIISVLMASIEE